MSADRDPARARYGWQSDFPTFADEEPRVVRISLQDFLGDVGESQIRAWDDSIPKIQVEVGEVVDIDDLAEQYTAILEYELPLESRRPDVVLLVSGAVVVLELRARPNRSRPTSTKPPLTRATCAATTSTAQIAKYTRSSSPPARMGTRAYATVCTSPAPTRCTGSSRSYSGHGTRGRSPPSSSSPKTPTARCPRWYKPHASSSSTAQVRRIHRAWAETQPAIDAISAIAHEAARTHTRHLVLVAGVPGSGKTLVGLSAVHNPGLDDLRVERAGGKPPAPAIFLSGNGPLVEVLQYELRSAGGGGKTFVRGVKDYMKQYLGDKAAVPPQHVIVYDEAQRAWDLEQVIIKHPGLRGHKSEPEAFVEFGERIPEWCVLVGLIGTGQEINVGEEAGLGQWLDALQNAGSPEQWTVHAPQRVLDEFFADPSLPAGVAASETLDLTVELRFHFAADLDEWVDGLLTGGTGARGRELAARLETAGYHLRMTRDLDQAKDYFGVRYAEAPEARYGLVASSRDKTLAEWGIPNDYQSTKVMRLGPWYGDGEESHRSCRHLRECVTEFGAQGLELDGVLLAWGTDLVWEEGAEGAGAEGAPAPGPTRAPSAMRAPRTCATPSSCASTPTACCSPVGATGRSSSSRRSRARRHRRAAAGARGEGALSRFGDARRRRAASRLSLCARCSRPPTMAP